MKNLIIIVAFVLFTFIDLNAQVEYKVITSVESIVPNGLGRSRLISTNAERSFEDFTSDRTDEKRNKSKRSEIRVKDFEETKLL